MTVTNVSIDKISKIPQVLQDLKIVAEILRAARNKKEALDFTIRILQRLGFDRVRIWLVGDDEKHIYGAKSSYIPDREFNKIRLGLHPKKSSPGLIHGLATKKPFLNDYNPTLINHFGDKKDVVTVGLPLISGRIVIGVISVDNSTSGRKLSLTEIESTIAPFINNAALVLHRFIAEEKITSLNQELKLTTEILRVARNQKDVLEFAVGIFMRLGFDRVRIWLIDEDEKEIFGAKSSHISDQEFSKVRGDLDLKKLSFDFINHIRRGKPFMNKTLPIYRKFFRKDPVVYSLDFPLLAGDHCLGLIAVDNAVSGRKLSLKKLEPTIMPFVNHIALVLYRVLSEEKIRSANRRLKQKVVTATQELAEKNKELSYLVTHDPLTDLPNRRDFDAQLAAEFKKAGPKNPLTLAILDIDFLKQVNDVQGHLAGDRLIANVGEMLGKDRDIIYAARYAGDEFVILLPGKKCTAKKCLLSGLLPKVKNKIKQSVCIGAAVYPGPGVNSPMDLMRLADDALYHAKHTGRNRAVCLLDSTELIPSATERQQTFHAIEKQGTEVVDYIKQLEIVSEVSEELRDTKEEQDVIRRVLHIFCRKLGFKRIRIYVADKKEKSLSCTLAVGIRKSDLANLCLPLNLKKSVAAEVVLTKKVIDIKNVKTQKNFNQKIVQLLDTKATLAIPLIVKSRAIGALMADYDPDKFQFQEHQYRFFLTIGNHVAMALEQARLFSEIKDWNRNLKKKVQVATKKLQQYSRSLELKISDNKKLREKERQTHFEILSALAVSLESKDEYTRGHSVRVAGYAQKLGVIVGLNIMRLADLRYASLLHDIGKISIDQELLHKDTALNKSEMTQISQHPKVGARILRSIKFLKNAAQFVRHHHERFDGRGYPNGLKGEKIPLESRIINIVDAYDAMVTRRSYNQKMTKADALREIRRDAGKQFDPKLVKFFIKVLDKK